jgi:hypothetical protein
MDLSPFDLENWLIRCKGARINLDHSGVPSPYADGFNPHVDQYDIDDYEL